MARMVNCVKLHKEAEGLDYPPFPGELGVRIWKNVSKEAWADWTRLQTMMVNEYGLNLADASARKHLMTQCERYFFRRWRGGRSSGLQTPSGRRSEIRSSALFY